MRLDFHRMKSRFRSYAHVITANIYNRLGFITLPYAAHFIPTWRCNLKCRMCKVWRKTNDAGIELSTVEMLKIIRQLKSLDVVKITGGEPFLREDLGILVSEIRKAIKPFILQIITNGFLTDRILEFAKSFGYASIYFRISIDGIDKTHDSMRGVEGSFSRAYSTLLGLVELRKKSRFTIGINFNVTDETINDAEKVIKICDDLKIDFIPGIPVTPFLEDVGFDTGNHKPIMLNNKGAFWEYRERTNEGIKGLNFLERTFLKKLNNIVFTKLTSGRENFKFPCRELRNLLYLFPDGNVVTCGLNHKRVGNLTEKNLKDIWFGKEIEASRRKVDECSGCLQSAVEILSRIYLFTA